MKIGVISDTHNFFDPRIAQLFKGVDHILHAGDVGTAVIRFQLEEIAPLTAVLGNVDSSVELQLTESVTLDGRRFLLQHIVEPRELGDDLKVRIARERPDVVVFGHTHRPFCQIMGGVLFFNPGYAGKSRFGMDRSVAILQSDDKGIRPQFLPL
jgi:putative phosphoesterase